jgi:hypothetical protein
MTRKKKYSYLGPFTHNFYFITILSYVEFYYCSIFVRICLVLQTTRKKRNESNLSDKIFGNENIMDE